VLCSEVLLLALVHSCICLLDLLLDLLLHLFLLGLSHRLELVASAVAAVLLAVLALLLVIRTLLLLAVVLLLALAALILVLLDLVVSLDLGHVHLLASVLADSLSLLLFLLLVELREVDLVDYLRSCKTFYLDLHFTWLRLLFRLDLFHLLLCDLHIFCRSLLHFRLCRLYRWGRGGLRLCNRLRCWFLLLCSRLLLVELREVNLVHYLEAAFLLYWSWFFLYRLRLYLCHSLFFNRLNLRSLCVERIALDHNLSFRHILFFTARLLLRSHLNDFLELDRNLLRVLLKFKVFTELRLDSRQIFVRYLCVRIHLYVGSLLVEEINESCKSDAELLCKFT